MPRARCTNLVGRDAELNLLCSAFDAMSGGRAVGVLIGGDAGIGKTRLVEEFCDEARLQQAAVATGMCVPADGGLPYAPVMGILRQLGRPSASELLHTLGDPTDAQPTGPFGRTVFFEAVLEVLIELAETAPVVLVFEDLHWADSGSSLLIDFLVRNLGDARVLIIGTYRTDDLGQADPLTRWLAELGRHPRVTSVELGPLARPELAALINHTLGERAEPALLDSVWNRSLGNPFFAEELVAARDAPALPVGLRSAINARVGRRSAPARRTLDVLACAGAVVDHALLAAVHGGDADTNAASIAEAIDHKLVVLDPADGGYRFRHALIREAVYEAMLPVVRRALHRAIAEALTADDTLGPSVPGHRVAELAAHWWAAGDWAAAVLPSVRAADAAVAVHAFREAIVMLERALLAGERAPGAIDAAGVARAGLLERAADIAYLAGENARAVELAREAIGALDAPVDPVAAARCYTLLGRNLWGVGESEDAFDAYANATRLLPSGAPSVERARLLAEVARGHMLMSRFTVGARCAREAIVAAQEAGARGVEGHALNTLGSCRGELGWNDEAITLLRQSLSIAEELEGPEDLNRAYGNLGSVFLGAGRLEEAVALMFDSAAVGESLWGVRLNGSTGNGVEALVRLGRYAEAEHVLGQIGTTSLAVCAPSPWTLPSPILIRQGRFSAAERTVATAWEMSSRLEDVQTTAVVLGIAGELDLERGHPEDADAHLTRALELALRSEDETYLPELAMWAARAVADRCEAERHRGVAPDVESMRRRADEIAAAVSRMSAARADRGGQPTPRTLAAQAQTAAERSRLDRSDPALWEAAAQAWAVAREPYPRAYCRWREAEALADGRGSRASATDCLNEAWRLSRELGAAPLSERIAGLATRARLGLREAEVRPPAPARVAEELGLTAREVEVLGQLARGRSDKEIGDALVISRKTVSVHVSNVLRKLGVANRVEAAKVGQAHGMDALSGTVAR
ncbi:MAG TPA: AAA family ATPase [Jatrophihabitantaceae bacterium]